MSSHFPPLIFGLSLFAVLLSAFPSQSCPWHFFNLLFIRMTKFCFAFQNWTHRDLFQYQNQSYYWYDYLYIYLFIFLAFLHELLGRCIIPTCYVIRWLWTRTTRVSTTSMDFFFSSLSMVRLLPQLGTSMLFLSSSFCTLSFFLLGKNQFFLQGKR